MARIDMDGVIYRENQLVPGAVEFVEALVASGTPFLFLTRGEHPQKPRPRAPITR